MEEFNLYLKTSIQLIDNVTKATLETIPISNWNQTNIYIVDDNEASHIFYSYFHKRFAIEPRICLVYDINTDRLYSNCVLYDLYITILQGINETEIEKDSRKYHHYLNTLYLYQLELENI